MYLQLTIVGYHLTFHTKSNLSPNITLNLLKTPSIEEHQEPLYEKPINLPIVTVPILIQEYVIR